MVDLGLGYLSEERENALRTPTFDKGARFASDPRPLRDYLSRPLRVTIIGITAVFGLLLLSATLPKADVRMPLLPQHAGNSTHTDEL